MGGDGFLQCEPAAGRNAECLRQGQEMAAGTLGLRTLDDERRRAGQPQPRYGIGDGKTETTETPPKAAFEVEEAEMQPGVRGH